MTCDCLFFVCFRKNEKLTWGKIWVANLLNLVRAVKKTSFHYYKTVKALEKLQVYWKYLNQLCTVCGKNLDRKVRQKTNTEVAAENYWMTALVRQVREDRKRPLCDVTSKFNENNNANVSKKTIWRSLKRNGYRRCVCKKKIRIRVANRVKRVRWCAGKRNWTVENDWRKVIFSDESQIVIGNDCRIYVWRKSNESWLSDCISPGPGIGKKISVMIWGCITYHGVGTLCRVIGNINKILKNT